MVYIPNCGHPLSTDLCGLDNLTYIEICDSQKPVQFREVKRELVNAINMNEFDQARIIIEAKPKRSHQNMGGDRFRGSKYRGVSKNKNKWQVSKPNNQNISNF